MRGSAQVEGWDYWLFVHIVRQSKWAWDERREMW